MTHDIDEIILDFTPQQYEKYLSVINEAKNGSVKFDIDTAGSVPCLPSCEGLKDLLASLEGTAKDLLSGYDVKRSFFSTVTLTKKESESLMTLYYRSVTEISRISSEINEFSFHFIKEIQKIECLYYEKVKAYQNLLPYKAALFDDPVYKEKIDGLDASLYGEVQNSLEILQKSQNTLKSAEKICENIIPNFLSKSGRAATSPPYDGFSASEFYSSVKNFIEQISNEARLISE